MHVSSRSLMRNEAGNIMILVAGFLVLVALLLSYFMRDSGVEAVRDRSCKGTEVCPDLVKAAARGDLTIMHQLLQQGANVNGQLPEHGESALHAAIEQGQFGVINELLEAGANLNLPDKHGATPLMMMIMLGQRGYVKLFLTKGADPNAAFPNLTNDGKAGMVTPLMVAASHGELEIIAMLLESDADRSLKDSRGRDAVRYAEEAHHDEAAELIVRKE